MFCSSLGRGWWGEWGIIRRSILVQLTIIIVSGLLYKADSFLSSGALKMDENMSVMGKMSGPSHVENSLSDKIFQVMKHLKGCHVLATLSQRQKKREGTTTPRLDLSLLFFSNNRSYNHINVFSWLEGHRLSLIRPLLFSGRPRTKACVQWKFPESEIQCKSCLFKEHLWLIIPSPPEGISLLFRSTVMHC